MKKLSVIFSAFALKDIEESVVYYETIQSRLGSRFVEQLQLTLNSIKRNPYYASVRYDNIRCGQVKKFPFLVHYYIDEKKSLVSIMAVYSTHREPLG